MAKFDLSYKPSALKELAELPNEKLRRTVHGKILRLADVSKPVGCRKVRGPSGAPDDDEVEIYRIRHGAYRVIYRLDETANSVRVMRVAHRKKAYRGLLT